MRSQRNKDRLVESQFNRTLEKLGEMGRLSNAHKDHNPAMTAKNISAKFNAWKKASLEKTNRTFKEAFDIVAEEFNKDAAIQLVVYDNENGVFLGDEQDLFNFWYSVKVKSAGEYGMEDIIDDLLDGKEATVHLTTEMEMENYGPIIARSKSSIRSLERHFSFDEDDKATIGVKAADILNEQPKVLTPMTINTAAELAEMIMSAFESDKTFVHYLMTGEADTWDDEE